MRKSIAIILSITSLVLFTSFSTEDVYWETTNSYTEAAVLVGCNKRKPRGYGYRNIVKERKMSNLKMIGKVGKFGVEGRNKTEKLYGKILRAMRFQNITRRVERKYNLPKNLVLAMVMQETGGADLLPNGLDDGGLGLCHMQPMLAVEYGLKTYQNNKAMRSRAHGRALRRLIDRHKHDRKKLIQYDDRFHPILNLDAVGRMLHCHQHRPKKGYTKTQVAILRYAGRYNYRKYWRNVQYFRRHLNDPKVIRGVERMFNKKNPKFKINNYKGNFKEYIRVHQDQNRNYGLDRY